MKQGIFTQILFSCWLACVALQSIGLCQNSTNDDTKAKPDSKDGPNNDNSTSHSEPINARKIVSAVIKAYGGIDKMKMHRELEYTGTISDSSDKTYAKHYIQLDDRYLMTIKRNKSLIIFGYDGTDGWCERDGKTAIDSQSELKMMQSLEAHSFYRVISETENIDNITLLPPRKINGRSCPGFSVPFDTDDRLCIWIDPETHLVLRTSCTYPSPVRGVPATSTDFNFEEYRAVSGLLVPFRFSATTNNQTTKTDWQNIKLIDPSSFIIQKPTESYTLLENVSVPISFSGDHIVVECFVNGVKGLFNLDTGSARTTINSLFAKASDIQATEGSEAVWLHGFFSSETSKTARIRTLKIAQAAFDDVPVLVRQSESTICAGNLGMDFLRHFCVRIDYRNRNLELSQRNAECGSNQVRLAMQLLNDTVYVHGTTPDNIERVFELDTGTPRFALFRAHDSQRLISFLDSGQASHHRMLHDVNGTEHFSTFGRLSNMRVGNLTFDHAGVSFVSDRQKDTKPTDILGLSFLWQFPAVALDFPRETLLIELPEGREAPLKVDCNRPQ